MGFAPNDAPQRQQYGQPMANFQARQFTLKDQGERCNLEPGTAKLFASESCNQATSAGIQIHGGSGSSEEFGVERSYRDTKLLGIGAGTNDIQPLVIARRLLALYRLRTG